MALWEILTDVGDQPGVASSLSPKNANTNLKQKKCCEKTV